MTALPRYLSGFNPAAIEAEQIASLTTRLERLEHQSAHQIQVFKKVEAAGNAARGPTTGPGFTLTSGSAVNPSVTVDVPQDGRILVWGSADMGATDASANFVFLRFRLYLDGVMQWIGTGGVEYLEYNMPTSGSGFPTMTLQKNILNWSWPVLLTPSAGSHTLEWRFNEVDAFVRTSTYAGWTANRTIQGFVHA